MKDFLNTVVSPKNKESLSVNVVVSEHPQTEEFIQICQELSSHGWIWASLSGRRYKFIREDVS